MSRLWYVNTAVHLWRFYFRYRTADTSRMSEADRLNWQACDRALQKFTEPEQKCLQQYYLTGYGNYEDMRAIEKFIIAYGMERNSAWDVVKLANYTVMVERGIINPNGGKANDE